MDLRRAFDRKRDSMPSSVPDKEVIRLRAGGKHALHLRYLVEDFFDEVIMTDGDDADFSLRDGVFTDHRTDPPTEIQTRPDNYLVEIHKYFSLEREDLGGWGIMHGVRPLSGSTCVALREILLKTSFVI